MRTLLAAVLLDTTRVQGGVPVFLAKSYQEQESLSHELALLLEADVHRTSNAIFLLIREGE